MFDGLVGGPDAATTLSLVSQAHRQVLEQECALVELAAHWADLHHSDSQVAVAKPLPGAERGRLLGGDGTPEVLEFAAVELGARMETTVGSARALMADALDIRHRLPQLWRLIVVGCVRSWRVRKVAQATRHLSRDAAMHVDAAVAGCIVALPWGRFETLLAAKIIEADPRAAEEQAKIWEAERFVRAGRTGQSGLKLLIAKANAGDVIWFMATLNRIAEILRLQGDLDSAEVRRSKAIGILAQPALALLLLWEFRTEQHPNPEPQRANEPIHNEPAPAFNHSSGPGEELLDTAADDTSQAQQLESAVEAAGRGLIIRPPGLDVRRLRPQVMLHIHLSQEALLGHSGGKLRLVGGAGRFEGVGPITVDQVRRFLADTACEVKVQPVIDPQDSPPVDGYEIPRRIREAMFLRMPASCFPYAAGARRMDLDHTQPYLPPARGGPPGQTGVHNLGPLIRLEHRVKTHSRWRVRQPEPGVWIWRSPHRSYYLVSTPEPNTSATGRSPAAYGRQLHSRAVSPSRPRSSIANPSCGALWPTALARRPLLCGRTDRRRPLPHRPAWSTRP
jgi:hypothetical protein